MKGSSRDGKLTASVASANPYTGRGTVSLIPHEAPAATKSLMVPVSTGSAPLSAFRSRERSSPPWRRNLVASAKAKLGAAVTVVPVASMASSHSRGRARNACGDISQRSAPLMAGVRRVPISPMS